MADSFADKYYPPGYFPPGYFQGGEQDPGAMSASLSGAGALTGTADAAATNVVAFTSTGRIRSGTTYHHKTLSQIEREKAAAKARKRIVRRIEEVTEKPSPFLALWDAEVAELTEQTYLTTAQWDAERARIDRMIWSAIRQAEIDAENDAVLLLMAAM